MTLATDLRGDDILRVTEVSFPPVNRFPQLGAASDATVDPGCVLSISISPDSQILAAGGLVERRLPTGRFSRTWTRLSSKHELAGVRALSIGNMAEVLFDRPGFVKATRVRFDPTGRLIAASYGSWTRSSIVKVHDVKQNKIVQVLEPQLGWINDFAFTPDGTSIITCATKSADSQTNGTVLTLWSLETGESRALSTLSDATHCIEHVPSSDSFITGGEFGRVRIWRGQQPKPAIEIYTQSNSITAIDVTKDGATFATVGSRPHHGDISIWSVPAGKAIWKVDASSWFANKRFISFGEIDFSPDGKLLAVPVGSWNRGAKWGELRILHVPSSKVSELILFDGNSYPVTAAAFSGDGRLLAAGDSQGIVRVWRIDDR